MVSHTGEYSAVADKYKDVSLFLNESLALQWGLDNLAAEQGVQGLRLKPQHLANTLYDLHFREFNGDALIALFLIFSSIAKEPQSPIVERSMR
jgi:hypothetical protein